MYRPVRVINGVSEDRQARGFGPSKGRLPQVTMCVDDFPLRTNYLAGGRIDRKVRWVILLASISKSRFRSWVPPFSCNLLSALILAS
jgi:hypothetical protein